MTYGGEGKSIKNIPIYQYDLFGRFINEYPSIGIAASKTNNSYINIIDCLNHRNNTVTSKGYQWSYEKKDFIGHPSIYTPVVCFDLNGKRLKEYYCINEASISMNISAPLIEKSCKDHKVHSYQYQWRYWDEVKELSQIDAAEAYTDKKKIQQYNLSGEFIKEYNSVAEAAILNNILPSNLSAVCNKKQKSAGGYLWKFSIDIEELNYNRKYNKKNIGKTHSVIQYDLNNNKLMTYNSLKDAAEALGKTSTSHISSCCSGKRNTAYGYKWRYANEEE